jgi:hypothetical protein
MISTRRYGHDQVDFPTPIKSNGKLFFARHEIEAHKRVLLGLPSIDHHPHEPILLVGAVQVAAEFGVHRRTLGRRVRGRIRSQEHVD